MAEDDAALTPLAAAERFRLGEQERASAQAGRKISAADVARSVSNEELMRQVAAKAGIDEAEIERMQAEMTQTISTTKLVNDFDEPLTRSILKFLIDTCEKTLPNLKLSPVTDLAYGVTLEDNPNAKAAAFFGASVLIANWSLFAFLQQLVKGLVYDFAV